MNVFAILQAYGDPDSNTAYDLLTIAANKDAAISVIATKEAERIQTITQRYTEIMEDVARAEQRKKDGGYATSDELFRPNYDAMVKPTVAHNTMTRENNWTYFGSREECNDGIHKFGGYVVEEMEVFEI